MYTDLLNALNKSDGINFKLRQDPTDPKKLARHRKVEKMLTKYTCQDGKIKLQWVINSSGVLQSTPNLRLTRRDLDEPCHHKFPICRLELTHTHLYPILGPKYYRTIKESGYDGLGLSGKYTQKDIRNSFFCVSASRSQTHYKELSKNITRGAVIPFTILLEKFPEIQNYLDKWALYDSTQKVSKTRGRHKTPIAEQNRWEDHVLLAAACRINKEFPCTIQMVQRHHGIYLEGPDVEKYSQRCAEILESCAGRECGVGITITTPIIAYHPFVARLRLLQGYRTQPLS